MFGTLLDLCDSVCEKCSSVQDIVFMCSEKKRKKKEKKKKLSVLGFVPAGIVSSSPTLQFYGDAIKPQNGFFSREPISSVVSLDTHLKERKEH